MADTFSGIYRSLRLYVPDLPILLAQRLVNHRYRQILDIRPWAGLRKQSSWEIPDAYTTGTASATQGSTTITGSGTTWTSGMIGRQIKLNGQAPILTITAVASTTSLTVDLAWPLATASAQTYQILQNYVTAPTDLKYLMAVLDPYRQWRLLFNYTQPEINRFDPARVNVGDTWIVADWKFSAAGVPLFELWPAPTTARGFTLLYVAQGADLTESDDTPIYPLRGDEILYGALADLCLWPGSREFANPLFGKTDLYATFHGKYLDAINNLEREDEGMYMTWLQGPGDNLSSPPLDSKFLQNHGYAALGGGYQY
jgi:hypothetical protein